MASAKRFLYVDDNKFYCEEVKKLFQERGYICDTATSIGEAHNLLAKNKYNGIGSDGDIATERYDDGLQFLASMRVKYPRLRLVLATARALNDVFVPTTHLDAFRMDRGGHTDDDRYYKTAEIQRRVLHVRPTAQLQKERVYAIQKADGDQWKTDVINFLLTGKKRSAGKQKHEI